MNTWMFVRTWINLVTRNTCGHICICIIIYRLAALHKNKTYLLSHNEYFEFGYLSGVCVCVWWMELPF